MAQCVHLSCMHASSISWTSSLLSTTCPPLSAKNPVMQVSLDGYWSGYLTRNRSYFLRSLASSGVRAEYLRSQYPTKTFPNHFSIVTVSCTHAVVCVTVCVASWMWSAHVSQHSSAVQSVPITCEPRDHAVGSNTANLASILWMN